VTLKTRLEYLLDLDCSCFVSNNMLCSTYIYDQEIPCFHGWLCKFLGRFYWRLCRNRSRSPSCLRSGVATSSSGHRGCSVDRAFTHGLEKGGPCHGLFSGSIGLFCSWSMDLFVARLLNAVRYEQYRWSIVFKNRVEESYK
jgi:hypothetical protein